MAKKSKLKGLITPIVISMENMGGGFIEFLEDIENLGLSVDKDISELLHSGEDDFYVAIGTSNKYDVSMNSRRQYYDDNYVYNYCDNRSFDSGYVLNLIKSKINNVLSEPSPEVHTPAVEVADTQKGIVNDSRFIEVLIPVENLARLFNDNKVELKVK